MMSRNDAVRIRAAETSLVAATTYLIPASVAMRVGTDAWRLDVAVMREAILQMIHRYARTFDDADRVLRAYDDESGGQS